MGGTENVPQSGSNDVSESLSESSVNLSLTSEEKWRQIVEVFSYDSTETILITIVMPCILAIGLFTNLSFIYVVFRVSWMRTNVNSYLFNLAIADILFLSVGVGDKLWHFSSTPFVLDEMFRSTAGCILVDLCTDSSYFTGLFLVTLVSFHRFNAICRPHSGTRQTQSLTMRWIMGAWFGGVLLSSLLIPSYSVMELTNMPSKPDVTNIYNKYPSIIGECKPIAAWMSILANLVQTVPFFIAMTMNTLMYIRIILSLNHIVDKGKEYGCKDVNTRIRNRVTKMLVANGCVFFMCLFPFELASVLAFCGYEIDMVWLHGFRTLLYINSAVNPIVYGVTNSKYRHAAVLSVQCTTKSHIRYELSIPLSRMKDNTAETNCRPCGGESKA